MSFNSKDATALPILQFEIQTANLVNPLRINYHSLACQNLKYSMTIIGFLTL